MDKNSAEKNTKSLISLHILNLEQAVKKIRLANNFNTLQHIITTEISPIFKDLHDKLNEVKNTDIKIEDYDVIVQAVAQDVDRLRQQLTRGNNSLIAVKTSLLQQTQRFENIQKKLEQAHTKLLTYLDQLAQSDDILTRKTNQKAMLVVEKMRTLIIAVVIGMLLIFLIFSRAIARRINAMAITIKAHSDELAAANHAIQQAHNKLTESNQLITESIGYASKIQRAMQSPSEALSAFSQDYFTLWLPRDTVGGDSYWIRP